MGSNYSITHVLAFVLIVFYHLVPLNAFSHSNDSVLPCHQEGFHLGYYMATKRYVVEGIVKAIRLPNSRFSYVKIKVEADLKEKTGKRIRTHIADNIRTPGLSLISKKSVSVGKKYFYLVRGRNENIRRYVTDIKLTFEIINDSIHISKHLMCPLDTTLSESLTIDQKKRNQEINKNGFKMSRDDFATLQTYINLNIKVNYKDNCWQFNAQATEDTLNFYQRIIVNELKRYQCVQ